MKNTALCTLSLAFIFLVASSSLHAGLPTSQGPVRVSTNQAVVDFVFFDANRISSLISNEGEIVAARGNGGISAMEWPRGTNNTINYQSGIWIAGKVNGIIRTAVAEYTSEFVPGTFADWDDPARADDFRIYVIDKNSGPGDIDWDEWPVGDGAPVDEFGNPKLFGDKTYWSVFTDADRARHTQLFATNPLGVEVRQLIWGYDRVGVYGDMMFVSYQIFNKGADSLKESYMSFWADVDLGDSNDDLVALVIEESFGYHYNDGSDLIYGAAPPAIGYDFFQGPIAPSPGDTAYSFGKQVPDYRNLPMTSFAHYVRGGDPWEMDPETAIEAYNFMQGLDGLGNSKLDDLGNVTKFSYTGDPVAGTGWLRDQSADLRFLMTSGPLTLAPGDSQEIVTAIVIAQGVSPLNSVRELKNIDLIAQSVYDRNFQTHEVSVSSPNGGEVLSGIVDISWTSNSIFEQPLRLDIYTESIEGDINLIAEDVADSGHYSWDSVESATADGFYKIVLVAFDSILAELDFPGQDRSDSLFTIDNPGNGEPFVKLESPLGGLIYSGVQQIEWTAADPDGTPLTINLHYSADNGRHWETVAENVSNTGNYSWDTYLQPNSKGIIRIAASDGELTSFDFSDEFFISNMRLAVLEDIFLNTIGDGNGPISANIIDAAALTEHTYKLVFEDDILSDTLLYAIQDTVTKEFVVQDAAVSKRTFIGIPRPEGPLFDGLRLSILNFSEVIPWRTEWTTLINDTSTYIPEFNTWQVREPADYEVRFLGEGADTSIIGGKTVPFQIWNITQSPERKVNIIIAPTTGEWGSGDVISFLEPDFSLRTWSLTFTWIDSVVNVAPQIGDILTLYTGRPYLSGDEIYFNTTGRPIGVEREMIQIPLSFSLKQNYPNPFNPTTTLEYSLFQPGDVSLIVYNLLGEEVARLVDEAQQSGNYKISWDASNISSGIYFYRLQVRQTTTGHAGDFTQTRKMLLLK